MALQILYGASGAGKSHAAYRWLLEEAAAHPDVNYILLVPEQYSMALQKKLVLMSPDKGYMNIDVIGMNRLAYRVFDELHVKQGEVLMDFGKTMMLRLAASRVKDDLKIYGDNLNKNGMMDELKSLMSEMYQYDCDRERLRKVTEDLSGQDAFRLLTEKLSDLLTIYDKFDEMMKDRYIVAEQNTELLAARIPDSEMIKNSVIVMDGFTGFTPIQYKVVRALITCAKDVKVILTLDRAAFAAVKLPEHALFALSNETKNKLLNMAREEGVTVEESQAYDTRPFPRWKEKSALPHLEANLFRYPYTKYPDATDDIEITVYADPFAEMEGVAGKIASLVRQGTYRFRDIAVICADIEDRRILATQIFPGYGIPFFADATIPLKNNVYVDAITHLLRIMEDDFSYGSTFAFLKTGILEEFSQDDIDLLENYVLALNIRGHGRWSKPWDVSVEEIRSGVASVLLREYQTMGGKRKRPASAYVRAVYDCMTGLSYEERMKDEHGLFETICVLLDKLDELMGTELLTVGEFSELLSVGLSDLAHGIIPPTIDSVTLGDMTRSRLDEVKVLFIVGVNDGVIPNYGTSPKIITDHEKELLADRGISLAPTDRMNAYTEQFYLYLHMTKPKNMLLLSYTEKSGAGEPMRPSYVIDRIRQIFPKLAVTHGDSFVMAGTDPAVRRLSGDLRSLKDGEGDANEAAALLALLSESGEELRVKLLSDAIDYTNLPKKLSGEVRELIYANLLGRTVSRLEQYAQCAYAYYLKHILGLDERREGVVSFTDMGNILHKGLEELFGFVKEERENDWMALSEKDREELSDRFIGHVFDDYYAAVTLEPGMRDRLRGNLLRIARRTTRMLTEINRTDGFSPEYLEYKFDYILSNEDRDIKLYGIIDRGDIKVSGDKLLLRVIDYKSGSKEFKLSELMEGLELQLSVYMSALLAEAEKHPEFGVTEVIPEGMYYYRMKDPFVTAEDEASAEKAREKELKLWGTKADDPVFFREILDFADKKAAELMKQMADGRIDKSPIKKDSKHPCEYCAYKDVCRFDPLTDANRIRYKRYTDKKDGQDKIRAAIHRAVGGGE